MIHEPNPSLVERNEARKRFEMATPAGIAWLDYRLLGTTLYLTHAEVPRAARGAGFAGQVTKAALEWARARGFKVIPQCGYVAAYIQRHEEFADLLVSS
jgi:predicted GNAT family acetyltransferase